jgi:hypothetical protein
VSERVIDSSVIVAILKGEPFDVAVLDKMEGAVMSAVNYDEVLSKRVDLGMSSAPRTDELLSLLDALSLLPFRRPGSARLFVPAPGTLDFRWETAHVSPWRLRSGRRSTPRIERGRAQT